MVPNTLFSNFDEDDYNQADSGDDSDSEEPMEEKEIVQVKRQANGKKEIKEEVRSETAKSEGQTFTVILWFFSLLYIVVQLFALKDIEEHSRNYIDNSFQIFAL